MLYAEIMLEARGQMGAYCKACPICDGKACGNHIPGPGSKPPGNLALRNYNKWQELCINMDTISENRKVDTTFELFGRKLTAPILAAPIGGMNLHYGEKHSDKSYNSILVKGCIEAGTIAVIGDNADPKIFAEMLEGIAENDGNGIPTIKPWNKEAVFERLDLAKKANAFACAMDIDGAGLPFLKKLNPNAGTKTVEELKEIIKYAKCPFIIKGIMTAKAALKAVEAGADGIVVSNHGGRVQGGLPSTCEVLPEIVKAVKGKTVILVDGGIRSGVDVFRALALGADAVLIGRPFVPVVYGAGKQGVVDYISQLSTELKDTMTMCGAHIIKEINKDMIRI